MTTSQKTIQIFWQTGLAHKRLLLLALMYPIGNMFYNTITPLIISKMLAAIAVSGGRPTRYIPYFIIFATAGVLLNRYGFAAMLRHQAKTMSLLQTQALEVLLKRSLGFHNNNVGGKLVSDAIDYSTAYSQLAGAIYATLIPFLLTLVSGVILIFWNSWILGLIMLGMILFALGSGIYESRQRKPMREQRLHASKAVTSHTADTILNVQTVKTFAAESHELKHHEIINKELTGYRLRDWSNAAYKGNNRIAVLLFMQLILLITAIHLTKNNPLLLGPSIFAFSFTVILGTRLFEINTILRTVEDALLQASPMTEIIEQTTEIPDSPMATKLIIKKGVIKLDNIDFQYQDVSNSQTVFTQLAMEVKSGEKIGLVGPSGGGKSTLTSLLLRFEDITGGSITIDGQDIRNVTQKSLREAISYVPQEPLLFHRSILENIRYGKPGASIKEVEHAARLAHAIEFIIKLPLGFDTIVGERGVKLSGGQRQRVAIARAMIKDAPILVLDEATSALDSESEKLIQAALWKLMEGRTTIVIAHRLSTIQHMDRIVVLDNGRVVEEGAHKDLVKKKDGLYARLWSHQSGGFLED